MLESIMPANQPGAKQEIVTMTLSCICEGDHSLEKNKAFS
jgi:hypothetical protein